MDDRTLTVGQLLEQLARFDPDLPVTVARYGPDGEIAPGSVFHVTAVVEVWGGDGLEVALT